MRTAAWAALALAACGGKVAFDGQPSGGTTGQGGASSSTVAASSATTTVAATSTTGPSGSTSSSSSSGSCWIADKATCLSCCATLPTEYAVFQKHILARCGCDVAPSAVCAAVCKPNGVCVDVASLDHGDSCTACLVGQVGLGPMSQCLLEAVTEDCTTDCPNFAQCEVGCHT